MTSPDQDRQFRRPRRVLSRAVTRRHLPHSSQSLTAGPAPARWAALLTVLMLFPYAIFLWEEKASADPLASAGHICRVLADLFLLGTALVLTLEARLTGEPLRARLATAATLIAIQDLPLVVAAVADPVHSGQSYRITAGYVLTVALVVWLLHDGLHGVRPPRVPPLLSGLALGIAVLGVRLVMTRLDHSPYLSLHHPRDIVVLVTVAGLACVAVLQLARSPLPRWAGTRFAGAVLALVAARLWATVVPAPSSPPLAILGLALGSSLMFTAAVALLLRTLIDAGARERTLLKRATNAEATVQHDREVAHEMRALSAGIVAGVHLLAEDRVPPGPRRAALVRMVDQETARLGRCFCDHERERPVDIAVDRILESLALAQESLGHHVDWRPQGYHVLGRPDELAEVLNVLLHNARRHGGGRGTTVTCRTAGPDVRIRVADRGPGVEPELRDRLFQWGARGARSTGQGIGLQRAHRLALELGGSLELESSEEGVGASFVLTLPGGAIQTIQAAEAAEAAQSPDSLSTQRAEEMVEEMVGEMVEEMVEEMAGETLEHRTGLAG